MPEARFFHKIKPVRTFIHMKAPRRDKKEKGQLTITFRMGLDPNNVDYAPDFVRTAYEEITVHSAGSVSLTKVIEGVSLQILDTDTSEKAAFSLETIMLENLEVAEISSSTGDKSTVLKFQTTYPWEAEVWQKMGRYYGKDVFLVFDSSQASLLDAMTAGAGEDEDSAQPELLPREEKSKRKGKGKKDGKAAAAGDREEVEPEAE